MTERSAWTVVPSKRVIVAGLLTTTEASPSLTPEPANAAPRPLTLLSLSWEPDAWTGARASARRMRSARTEACRVGEIRIENLLTECLRIVVWRALYRGGWSCTGVPRHACRRLSL